jgi:hypothetical protein
MKALVQTRAAPIAPSKAIEVELEPHEPPSKPLVRSVGEGLAYEPRAFPESSRSPALPSVIRDEMMESYAFIFCQGGFRHLGMTFEQFLLVAAAIKPADFPRNREEA